MRETGGVTTGLLMAYILPGFATLLGLSYVSPIVRTWLSSPDDALNALPTVGGFMFVTLASLAMGLTVSAVRFVLIDRIFALVGLPRSRWDDTKLQDNLEAYRTLIAIHYNYYRFYSNSIVAILIAYAARRLSMPPAAFPDWTEPVAAALVVIFAATSYDNLRNYYRRADRLLGTAESETAMSNGGHHGHESKSKRPTEPKHAETPKDRTDADRPAGKHVEPKRRK